MGFWEWRNTLRKIVMAMYEALSYMCRLDIVWAKQRFNFTILLEPAETIIIIY